MDGAGDLANAGELQGDGMVAGRERTHEGLRIHRDGSGVNVPV